MRKLILVLAVLALLCSSIKSQSNELSFSLGADLVSSYVWRGTYQAKSSFQPTLGFCVGGFSLSAWASTEIVGSQKEIDFTGMYKIAGLSFAITDYWWSGEKAYRYLTYDESTAHYWEASFGYTLPVKSFPLSISVNTMFAGADKKEGENKNNYSTYIEATLPFSVKEVDLNAGISITPEKGLYASQAAVVNINLKATKIIKVSDNFSLPVFGQIILNPDREDIFFVFGITL